MKKIQNKQNVEICTKQKVETRVRRKLIENWERLERSTKYQKAAARVSSNHLIQTLKEELFDGILLNFRGDVANKSYSQQKRNLRRIVEKRQAQSMHRIVGRSGDRYASHMVHHYVGKSITQLHNHMWCA